MYAWRLFVAVALDYEKGQLHVLSVTAVDRGPDSLPAHVNVVVLRGDVLRRDVIRVDVIRGDVLRDDVLRGDVILSDVLRGDIIRADVLRGDLLRDSLPTHVNVVVRVDDVNDNAPQIAVNSLTATSVKGPADEDDTSVVATVDEGSPPGTFVAHLSVSDADKTGKNGRFRCAIDDRRNFRLVKMSARSFTNHVRVHRPAGQDVPANDDRQVCDDLGAGFRRHFRFRSADTVPVGVKFRRFGGEVPVGARFRRRHFRFRFGHGVPVSARFRRYFRFRFGDGVPAGDRKRGVRPRAGGHVPRGGRLPRPGRLAAELVGRRARRRRRPERQRAGVSGRVVRGGSDRERRSRSGSRARRGHRRRRRLERFGQC